MDPLTAADWRRLGHRFLRPTPPRGGLCWNAGRGATARRAELPLHTLDARRIAAFRRASSAGVYYWAHPPRQAELRALACYFIAAMIDSGDDPAMIDDPPAP
jgi:hypothetical protein